MISPHALVVQLKSKIREIELQAHRSNIRSALGRNPIDAAMKMSDRATP